MVVERLVRCQALNGSNPFAPITLSPLKSMRYAAFSTATSTHLYGQYGQHHNIRVFTWKFEVLLQ
jgi:hypothetical protein